MTINYPHFPSPIGRQPPHIYLYIHTQHTSEHFHPTKATQRNYIIANNRKKQRKNLLFLKFLPLCYLEKKIQTRNYTWKQKITEITNCHILNENSVTPPRPRQHSAAPLGLISHPLGHTKTPPAPTQLTPLKWHGFYQNTKKKTFNMRINLVRAPPKPTTWTKASRRWGA